MNWKQTLATVAPAIATALGSPVAGMAVKVLAKQFLGNEEASEKEVEQAILSATPEQLAELRRIDYDFKIKAQQLGIDLEVSRQEQLTKRHASDMMSDSWFSKNIRPLALIYLMCLFTLAFFMDVPKDVLEMLQSLLMTTFAFYFTARSVEKVVGIVNSKS